MACRLFVKLSQLSKSLPIPKCFCQQLDQRLTKIKKSQNMITHDNMDHLLSRCWKEEPLCFNQPSAKYRVSLSLSSIQQGGHLPVVSCHWTDRPVWLHHRDTCRRCNPSQRCCANFHLTTATWKDQLLQYFCSFYRPFIKYLKVFKAKRLFCHKRGEV